MTDSSGAKKWRSLLAQSKREKLDSGSHIAGRFRVEEHLGSGGMGMVLSAFDTQHNQEVAIKILRAADVDEVAVERFVREARTSMRIQSPYVAKVFDTGMDQGRPFIVMERLMGMDMSDRLRQRGPLSLSETADILLMVCEALANAHGAGIVHRDIKLSNLFMTEAPQGGAIIKVLDFGISKARGRGEYTLTESNDGLLGSPPYMAPEQIRNAKTVDHRADIWSLGVVAYRLLSGEHPYQGETVGEVFASIFERRFHTLESRGVHVPPEMETVISNCMQVDLSKRYQNVGEVAAAIGPLASTYGQALVQRVIDLSRKYPPPAVGGQNALAEATVVDAQAHYAWQVPWYRRQARVVAALLSGALGVAILATLAGSALSQTGTAAPQVVREHSQVLVDVAQVPRAKLPVEEPSGNTKVLRVAPSHPGHGKPKLQDNPYGK